MLIDADGYARAGIHEFKNNISRYLRLLEEGQARAVVICRSGKKPAGLFVAFRRPHAPDTHGKENEDQPKIHCPRVKTIAAITASDRRPMRDPAFAIWPTVISPEP